jgi:hypothetical protein
MKSATIGIMTLFALTIQPARSREKAALATVSICVETAAPFIQTGLAESVASAIYAGIGIKLDWRHGSYCPTDALILTLTLDTPEGLMPGSMAYAKPYEGKHVRVFYDRVSNLQPYPKHTACQILGHVLAHEIGHMLQRTSRHSETGVMKAQWTAADYKSMAVRPFRFTAEDVELILAGLPTMNRSNASLTDCCINQSER